MGIDRERKPRHEFFRKEKPVKQAKSLSRGGGMKSSRRPDCKVPPAEGPIRLYLDDERECPEGFVIARDFPAFRDYLDTIDLERLETVSLDWHLGGSNEFSGHDAARLLRERIEAQPERFGALRSIWLHSSITEEAIKMARPLERLLMRDDVPGMPEDVYVIVDTYSPNVGL